MKLNKIQSLIEVKSTFSIDVEINSGFWQLCAEMMTAQSMNSDPDTPIFGALTDGFSWCFVKLQQKFISVSDVINGCYKVYRFVQCSERVFSLLNYLLAMVNWSGNISIKNAMSVVERKIEENTKFYFDILDVGKSQRSWNVERRKNWDVERRRNWDVERRRNWNS